jgi:N-acetylglutamate synthase-like GNAT family acetyltransferase
MSGIMAYRTEHAELKSGEFTFSATKKKLDLQYIYNLLCIPSRYSTGLPPERFALVVENSLCFSVFHQDKQIGFARVITDYTEFAALWDVIIDEPFRGKGLGKTLMKYILDHPRLKGIFRWFLMTEDAHGLYQKYGFKTEAYNPYVMMKLNM